jgi:hypothetical protein
MNLVAFPDARSLTWSWRIVDPTGREVATSTRAYPSVAAALEAGTVHLRRLAAGLSPIFRRGSRRRPAA